MFVVTTQHVENYGAHTVRTASSLLVTLIGSSKAETNTS